MANFTVGSACNRIPLFIRLRYRRATLPASSRFAISSSTMEQSVTTSSMDKPIDLALAFLSSFQNLL